MQPIVSRVEDLALALVEASPDDRESLVALHQQLSTLAESLGGGSDLPVQVAREATRQLRACLDGAGDAKAVLRALGDAVAAWQLIHRDGAAPGAVEFPAQLIPAPATPPAPAPAPAAAPPAPPHAAEPAPPEEMQDLQLMGEFVTESIEHLESADQHLLTLESDPTNLESVNAVFRAFHSIKGVASFFDLADITTVAHEAENLLDRARKGELSLAGDAIELAFASADLLKGLVSVVRNMLNTGGTVALDPRVPGLLERLRVFAAGGVLKFTPSHKEEHPATEAPAPEATPDAPAGEGNAAKETVRVDRERLDRLVDTIGELVIAESMVHRDLVRQGSGAPDRNVSRLYKITRELQQLSLSLRMVPLRATLQKMARVARDVARKLGKQVEFQTEGEDTELDKTVVDQIGDPLVHIVRNAIDHGLEMPADRKAAEKPPRGMLMIRAFHRGGSIYIEVQDDGKGINRAAVLAKAKDRGLISSEDGMTDREVYNLIFLPGFSMAKQITDVSGRGVGMDVVKRNIEALRGAVEVRSELGKGSTISLRLPLTLAIIDGMVVRVGGNRYILPTASVIELVRPTREELSTVTGRAELMSVRGRQVPLFRVGKVFGAAGAINDPTQGLVIVVEDDQRLAGLLVDEIIGQQQVVIKSLGASLEGLPGLAGGAVLPDGRVGLIIDVHGLLNLARRATTPRFVHAVEPWTV